MSVDVRADTPAMPGGRVLAAVAVAAALTPLNSTMIAVALPAMSRDFQASASSVAVWVVTAYLVATIVAQMPAGSVADRVGYARTLAIGRWMFAAGAAAAALAPSLELVITGRLMMAIAGALMVPTAMALLRVVVPLERRPRAFGAMGAVMGGAAALGPALGGLLIARAGWRVLFIVNLPLALLSWLLQPAAITDGLRPRARTDGAFDWPGSLLLGVALVLCVTATRLTVPVAWVAASLSAVFFIAFVVQERRVRGPVLDLTLFREVAFTAGSLVIALQNLAMYALLIQVPFLFGGGGSSRIGVAVMGMTAVFALMSPVGGRLAERIGSQVTVCLGGLAGAMGIVALGQLPPHATPVQVGLRLLLVGVGLGLSTGPSQAAALSAIEADRSGMGSAALSTLRYMGAVAGTAILGIALAGDGTDLARQYAALWIFTGAFVLSALAGLGLGGSKMVRET